MAILFFSDNTVLVNFGLINRVDLLGTVLGGRGRWCPTVRTECARSARQPGLASLADVEVHLGDPVDLETADMLQAMAFRDRMAKPGDVRTAHLGEAETLAVMSRRFQSDYFVTDDRAAKELANQVGIGVVSTWGLLRMATKAEHVSPLGMLQYLRVLHEEERGGPTFGSVGEVRAWAGLPPDEPLPQMQPDPSLRVI